MSDSTVTFDPAPVPPMRKTDTTINIALPTMAALDATALTPAQLRAAAVTVAANAVDADDARRLLDMLGLEAS